MTRWNLPNRLALFSLLVGLPALAVALVLLWRLEVPHFRIAAASLFFLWIAGPERILVSWPTMLGYAGLVLAALGVCAGAAAWVWLALAAVALLLSLGPELRVGGESTGVPLLYASFGGLAGLLRKSDKTRAEFFSHLQRPSSGAP